MDHFRDEYRAWLNAALAEDLPSDVEAFAFNLFEKTSDNSRYGIELIGLCALFGHRFTVATTTASVSGVVQSGWPSRRSIFVNRTGNILRSPLQKGRHDGRP
jgi:hypothetical protein